VKWDLTTHYTRVYRGKKKSERRNQIQLGLFYNKSVEICNDWNGNDNFKLLNKVGTLFYKSWLRLPNAQVGNHDC
jgi:hypothetical protein